MNSTLKVLIPFDFSIASVNALNYAVEFIINSEGASVQLIYVDSDALEKDDRKEMEEKLQQVVDKYHRNTRRNISYRIKTGELTQAILDTQAENKSDFIIMGTHSADSADSNVTKTADLVVQADCPVFAIPLETKNFQIKKIALTVGKEEIDDAENLRTLLFIARKFNAEIHVLTIYNEGDRDAILENKNERTLQYYFEHFYSQNSYIISSNIRTAIFDYVQKEEIDLLAVLPRNHTVKGKPSEGRLTKILALQTKVPFLTID